jgi:hypothetical protein
MPDFPTTNDATFVETPDDVALARALDLLARAVEASSNSAECVNGFETVTSGI